MKKLLVLFLVVFISLAFVGCADNAATPDPETPESEEVEVYRVAISLPPADNAWQAALLGFIQEAVKDDTEIEWTVVNAVDNADQNNILSTFKDGGYDVIACLPGDGTLMTSIMEEIYDSGTPTIIIDRAIESDKYTSFVAEDNYSCGAMAAEFIGNFFEGEENIKLVNLRSYTGIPIDLARYNGFMDTIVNYPNIEIIGEGDGEFNSSAGFNAMSNLLAAHGHIDGVFTHDDEATIGAMTAIEQQGRTDIRIITGMGGTKTAMANIKADNTIHKATASYFPRIGAHTVEVIREFLATGNIKKDNVEDSTLITKENVDNFLDWAYE
jgi:ribose transport system substrate-binding protein